MEKWKKKKIEEKKELEAVTPPTEHDDLGVEMESTGREVAAPTYEGKRKNRLEVLTGRKGSWSHLWTGGRWMDMTYGRTGMSRRGNEE